MDCRNVCSVSQLACCRTSIVNSGSFCCCSLIWFPDSSSNAVVLSLTVLPKATCKTSESPFFPSFLLLLRR
jgi:hypothetical protein